MLYKYLIIGLCILFVNPLASQDSGDAMKVRGLHFKLPRKDKNNAPLLVTKLIKGKSTDKEKFDAIFYWVAKNISYDESYFYGVSDAGPSAITDILRNRRTICLGYAQLMDSLCRLAGITNVSVFGYAKDRFYDIRDSIYGHNHAWNAVRLNDEWYVYDVTWSEGRTEYVYTTRAKFILKLLEKFPEKFKKKTKRVPRKLRKRAVCKKIEPIVYYKNRFFNSLIRAWLYTVPIRVYERRDKGVSTDFYLSDPMLFSATHVPDDPMWSLLERKKSFEFEQDSSFYYLNDSSYKDQQHVGTACTECDEYVESDWQKRMELLEKNSSAFNRNNKFITSYCNDELGRSLFYKSYGGTIDKRLERADSSVTYYKDAMVSIGQARKKIAIFFKYEKIKNDTKAKILLKENAGHLAFIKNKVKLTLYHNRAVKEMLNKTSAFATVYSNNRNRFIRFKVDYEFDKFKPYAPKRIAELEKINTRKTQQMDSLAVIIEGNKIKYDSIIANLSINIWGQVFRNDTIMKPFIECIKKRRFLLDNYKKPIVDIRRKIYPMEEKYTQEIDYLLYDPLTESVKLFNTTTKAIKLSQTLSGDLLKTRLELTKAKELSPSDLQIFKESVVAKTQDDFCWLASNYPKNSVTMKGLYALSIKQDRGSRILNKENATERMRQSIINKALKIGHKESMETIASDTKKVKRKYKEAINYRNEIADPLKFNKRRYDGIINRMMLLLQRN